MIKDMFLLIWSQNHDKMTVEMENPYIFITNHKINNLQEIASILEQIVQSNKPLLLIADDFESKVISTLVLNKLRGTFNVVATKAPGFGDNQKRIITRYCCFNWEYLY